MTVLDTRILNDVAVHSLLPTVAHMVAKGLVWKVTETTTTTAATAMPTTTAGVTLQNAANSPNLIFVLAAFVAVDVNAASLNKFGLAQMVNRLPVANFTRDIATTAYHATKGGQGLYNGQSIFDLGATVVDDGWGVVGHTVSNVANSAAWDQLWFPFEIPVVLEAGGAVSYELLSTSATTEGAIGLVFAEGKREDFGL